MVAKGEIRRKGRVLKAALARVQDGHPSLDCARCDGIFTQPRSFATEMGWRRYVRYVRSTPIATLETDRVTERIDLALSRLKQGFDPPRERQQTQALR
jgi:uncharacterized C2H2 Zn-finger protein